MANFTVKETTTWSESGSCALDANDPLHPTQHPSRSLVSTIIRATSSATIATSPSPKQQVTRNIRAAFTVAPISKPCFYLPAAHAENRLSEKRCRPWTVSSKANGISTALVVTWVPLLCLVSLWDAHTVLIRPAIDHFRTTHFTCLTTRLIANAIIISWTIPCAERVMNLLRARVLRRLKAGGSIPLVSVAMYVFSGYVDRTSSNCPFG